MKINKCMYCGSTAYGPGCPFSPHGKHVHPSDPKRCIYCGSYAHGPGCPFNPHSRVHVHGIEYNQMVNDSVETTITTGYLAKTLSQPITEMKAYKLGIINENGKKIKEPESDEERLSYTMLDQYLINLKQTFGTKIDLVNSGTQINLESSCDMSSHLKNYEAELDMKAKFRTFVENFTNLVSDAHEMGLNTATIEKIIMESFLD